MKKLVFIQDMPQEYSGICCERRCSHEATKLVTIKTYDDDVMEETIFTFCEKHFKIFQEEVNNVRK